jgi:hypothetical protein
LTAEVPSGLTEAFYASADARGRWRSFLVTKGVDAPPELADLCVSIADFIMPAAAAAAADEDFSRIWTPGQGWG